MDAIRAQLRAVAEELAEPTDEELLQVTVFMEVQKNLEECRQVAAHVAKLELDTVEQGANVALKQRLMQLLHHRGQGCTDMASLMRLSFQSSQLLAAWSRHANAVLESTWAQCTQGLSQVPTTGTQMPQQPWIAYL